MNRLLIMGLQKSANELSANLLDLVKGFESFNPNAYPDHKQKSIGYGTRALEGETSITKEQAAARLRQELAKARSHVSDYSSKYKYNFKPHEMDALTSFAYNIGNINELTDGGTRDRATIAKKMLEYNKASGKTAGGLVKRRAQEQAVFTGGWAKPEAPAAQPAAAPTANSAPSAAAPGPTRVQTYIDNGKTNVLPMPTNAMEGVVAEPAAQAPPNLLAKKANLNALAARMWRDLKEIGGAAKKSFTEPDKSHGFTKAAPKKKPVVPSPPTKPKAVASNAGVNKEAGVTDEDPYDAMMDEGRMLQLAQAADGQQKATSALTADDIRESLQTHGHPKMTVGAGTAMTLRGLRENTSDIDATVPLDVFTEIHELSGKPELSDYNGAKLFNIPGTDIDLHYDPEAEDGEEMDGVNGLVGTPAQLLKFYKSLDRDKDQQWIKALASNADAPPQKAAAPQNLLAKSSAHHNTRNPERSRYLLGRTTRLLAMAGLSKSATDKDEPAYTTTQREGDKWVVKDHNADATTYSGPTPEHATGKEYDKQNRKEDIDKDDSAMGAIAVKKPDKAVYRPDGMLGEQQGYVSKLAACGLRKAASKQQDLSYWGDVTAAVEKKVEDGQDPTKVGVIGACGHSIRKANPGHDTVEIGKKCFTCLKADSLTKSSATSWGVCSGLRLEKSAAKVDQLQKAAAAVAPAVVGAEVSTWPAVLASTAGGAATTAAAHKGVAFGADQLARRRVGGFFQKRLADYYGAMSRAGVEAGLSPGNDIMPRYRRAIGGVFPTLSGMADYEFSRGLAVEAREAAMAQGHQVPSAAGLASRQIDIKMDSPLSRNLVHGATDPRSRLANWLKQRRGLDAQKFGGRSTALAHTLMGGILHGPVGMAAGLATGAFDAGMVGLANRKKLNTIRYLKGNLARAGFKGSTPSAVSKGIGLVDPFSREVHDFGVDARRLSDAAERVGTGQVKDVFRKATHGADSTLWKSMKADIPQLNHSGKYLRAIPRYGKFFKTASLSSHLRQARNETHTHPTSAQAHEGNYAKGEFAYKGLTIKIENPKGTERRGYDKNGNVTWKRLMQADYGYFKNTKAIDGDAVDVFVGPDTDSDLVVAIDQYRGDTFDETKFIVGVTTQEQGEKLYLRHYPKGWKLGPVSTTTVPQIKKWLKDGNTKAPFKGQMVKAADWRDMFSAQ